MHKISKTLFPWRSHNQIRLHIDGEQFYPAILHAIALAKKQLLIEMYLVESGEVMNSFVNLLVHKAHQGVVIKLLFDSFGSHNLTSRDRETLTAASIELVFYNPVRISSFKRNLHRTHRKIIVVDGDIAFTGGAGITDNFTGENPWRDTMVEVQGEVVVDWQQLFLKTFLPLSANTASDGTHDVAPDIPEKRGRRVMKSRVVYSNGGTKIGLKRSLLKRIRSSQQTAWLATAYFIPSRKIRRALNRTARAGKDVRLLLPGEMTDHPSVVHASRRYYAQLLRHGVRIYEYQGRFMHTKIALVDSWSSIGSSNMDRWNLRWNLEANQEIRDEHFALQVKAMLLNDFKHSHEIILKEWQQRSKLQHFREWLWGKVDRWLTQWKN